MRRRGSKFRYSKIFTSSPTASPCATSCARSVKADCLFFALSQRIGEDMVGFSNKDTSKVQFAHLEEFCKQNSSHRKFNFILGLMPLRNPQNLLLSISAARGGLVAGDACKKSLSFSSSSLKSGNAKGDPRGNTLVSFLATSWETPRSSNKKPAQLSVRESAQYERP